MMNKPTPWLDDERMPTLNTASAGLLKAFYEHPHAPVLRNQSGPKLQAGELKALHLFAQNEATQAKRARQAMPSWLADFLGNCFTHVPFYRHYKTQTTSLRALPTLTRADLSQAVEQFVPDNLPTDRLIAYETSGTTGHPLVVPSHPLVAARYSVFHKKALAWHGIDTEQFTSDVAVVLAGYQQACFTYASISPYLNHKVLAKLNFHPDDWHDAADRAAFLDSTQPDLISGDPISLVELAKLGCSHSPKALLSTSMTLLDGVRSMLAAAFHCPVINLYSLNEVGPVAASTPDSNGLRLLQSRLWVEILDAKGQPVADGERGEITVTGGFNDYLPLIRYRTGDYAQRRFINGEGYLFDLEGRPPVQFQTGDGQWLNNVDITHCLQPFALSQFHLHQHANGDLELTLPAQAASQPIQQTLKAKLNQTVHTRTFARVDGEQKVIQYTSDLERF